MMLYKYFGFIFTSLLVFSCLSGSNNTVSIHSDDEVIEQIIQLNPPLLKENIRITYNSNNRISRIRIVNVECVDTIPPEIENLTELTELYIKRTNLPSIPKEIGNLKNLTKLYIADCKLTVIPKEIGNLVNLKELYLFKNTLTTLPEEIGLLSQLEILQIRFNTITHLPQNICNLDQLKELIVQHNQIKSLPRNFGKLSQLETLFLDENQLTSLPIDISNLIPKSLTLYRNMLDTSKNLDTSWKYKWQEWATTYCPHWYKEQLEN